jgi:ABC-type dipeptide/oligopeptide/nickel transport system ATPase component
MLKVDFMNILLTIKNLTITVTENNRDKRLVDSIGLEVPEQSIVALVGGSGSGKTTTGLAVLRLLPPALELKSGEIIFDGKNLLALSREHMRALRGNDIGMVFQEPLNAFNPVFTIGYQIEEVLLYHTRLTAAQRKVRILDLLRMVEIPDPPRVARAYPHQLSGGMRQRAMIAQAIAGDPKLIIADEPTSNLDVTLQARIMEVFRKLRSELGLSVLLITHDLGVVSHLADQVAVMQTGKIVESGPAKAVLENPAQAYTRQLINALGVESC